MIRRDATRTEPTSMYLVEEASQLVRAVHELERAPRSTVQTREWFREALS